MPIPTLAQSDLRGYILALLPKGWFSVEAKQQGGGAYAIADAMASNDYQIYSNLLSTQQGIYITTATGAALDAISSDFFGTQLPRNPGETDDHFRNRIVARLFLPIGTRPGMETGLTRALGSAPIILEQNDAQYTGGYSTPNWSVVYGPLAFNTGGFYGQGYGEPYQCLITVTQPALTDPNFMYAEDIYTLINDLKPIASTCWVRIIQADNSGIPYTRSGSFPV